MSSPGRNTVLYTVSKEKQLSSVGFAFFRMFLDFLQLWLLVVNPSYGWAINAKSRIWEVVSFIQLNAFLSGRGYMTFLVLLYIFVGLLAVNFGLSVWVAHSFSNNRFEFVWPIQFLRWFGLIFYQVLDIATLTLLLVTLDCNYFDVPDSIRFHNQEFPDVMCWSMPHIIHVGVSIASIVLFYVMATAMVVSEVELNPLSHNYMAMAHTRVEGIAFTIKVIATIASVMVSSVKWLSIAYLMCFTTLLYLHVKWVPFTYGTLNYVRCGSYATVLYCSVILVVMAFGPSGDSADTHRKTMTLVMWIGVAPAAIAGAAACHLRLWHFNHYVLGRFRDADPGMKSKTIYRFDDAREVEITARCCRSWIDEDTPEPEAVAMTEQVIKAGMTQLPQDPYMIVLYSSFLIDTAKKQSPGLLERFAIFSREQEHTQKASGANGGGDSTVDLVAYVEFQRNHRLVVRAHREALMAMRSFWGLLLRSEIDFTNLSRSLHRIEITVKAAERAYRSVLARHGSSARLVRLYGKFLESIKFDPWAASKWYTEADRLDEEAEHTKEALQLGGVETLLPGGGTDRGVMTDIEGVAIICINAQSLIQVASPEAHALLGYSKNELKGKDIGMIMPAPFGDRHSAYVRNYIQTGVSWVLDRKQEVVVVTKNKQVLPVTLRVTKVSGLNEDSVFLGIIEPVPPPPDEARAWVLGNGTIIAADERFCDWLGYEPSGLAGSLVEDAVVDKEMMREVIKMFSRAAQPPAAAAAPAKRAHRNSTLGGEHPPPALPSPTPGGGAEKPQHHMFGDKVHMLVEKPHLSGEKHGTDKHPASGAANMAACIGSGGTPPAVLPRTAWRHKYGDPLSFDTVIVPGAFGSVKVHKLFLRRCAAPPAVLGLVPSTSTYASHPRYSDMMLVADHRGRIQHVTATLAAVLGRAPDSIRGGGLDMLIPEPFGLLHGPWWQELANPQSIHPVTRGSPPPHSCRSGLAVSLVGYSEQQGPTVTPFRINIQHRLAASGSAKVHIVALEQVTVEEALSERRLRLTLDLSGTVTDIDAAPTELFGVDPNALRGQSISRLIDLFKPQALDGLTGPADAARKPAPSAGALGTCDDLPEDALGGDRAGGSGSPGASRGTAAAADVRTARALLELAKRSSAAPSISWRVGFTLPPDAEARLELEQLALVLGPDEVQAAAELMGMKTIPAIMRVRLVRKPRTAWKAPETAAAAADRGRRASTESNDRTLSGSSLLLRQAGAVAESTEGASIPAASLCLEVELWRADQLSGVLEVDDQGRVLRADATCPLGQSGLVLGAATSTLLGCSVADLLPLPPGGVEALFDPITAEGGVAGPDEAVRGGLKRRKSTKRKVGEPTVMTVRHCSDGCAMELRVQVVRRAGPMGSAYLLLHPASPAAAQPGFARWLYGGDTSGLMPEQSRGTVAGYSARAMDVPPGATSRIGMEVSMGRKASNAAGTLQTALSGPLEVAAAPFSPIACAPPPPPPFPGLSMEPISPMRVTALRSGGALSTNNSITAGAPSLPDSAKLQQRVSGVPDSAYETGAFAPLDSNLLSLEGAEQLLSRLSSKSLQGIAASPRQTAMLAPPAVALSDHTAIMKSPRKGKASNKHSGVSTWVLSDGRDHIVSEQAVPTAGAIKPLADADDSDRSSSRSGPASHMGNSDDDTSGPESGIEEPAKRGAMAKGKKADSAGEDATGTDVEMESEAGGHVANYGVGKRFKKLQRILTSPLAEQPALRLRVQALAIVALMLVAHTVTFVLLLTKLKAQKDAITDLDSVTMASRRIHEIAINGRLLESLYTGDSYVEGLTQFGDPVDETLAGVYDDTSRVMILLKEEHHGVYLGFRALRRIPTDFGLRDIWDNPILNITLFFDENDPAAPEHILHQASEGLPTSYRMMGLWDAGNMYLAKSLDLYNNAEAIVAKGINYTTWSTWKFLQANGLPVIFPAYRSTLDALVQLTVQQSKQIYQLQLIILCIEGGLLCISACFYMWIMADKFSHRRHSLYGVFIQIPIGVTRGLANMSLQLEAGEEVEEEPGMAAADIEIGARVDGDDDDEAAQRPSEKKGVRMDASVHGKAQQEGPQRRTSGTSLAFGLNRASGNHGDGAADDTPDAVGSSRFRPAGGGLLGAFAFWRNRSKVVPRRVGGKAKRRLMPSRRLSYALVAPFIIWGVVIITVNLIGYNTLRGMSAPIATLNVVNEVLVRFHRMIYYTLVFETEEGISAELRNHYRLATTGVLFGGTSRPADLLYHTDACLCGDPEACQPDDSPYFQATRNGLDVLLKAHFSSIESLIAQSDDASGLNTTEFHLLWATGQQDMEGGLSMMNEVFKSDVQDAYSKVEVQQVAMFAVAWVWALAFLVLQLRPFVRNAHNEMRRIAELLSQLPAEVDVEGLVMRVIVGDTQRKASSAAGKPGKMAVSDNVVKTYRPVSMASLKAAGGADGGREVD
ncbi:Tiny macrocysts protein B [Tetrabaena socialis]|uniref:Tiny macrocysts protein B n=1 Tax=Tetrabaena socialis TaxID=47790 RepID=A0A2J8AIC6_9CHLO|nr:Tiny macrocysts protein B [Tetrabaena socialis]|eukprot:PNH12265.1 Tiny macrocysts protein B [Tetrabaena socialis]